MRKAQMSINYRAWVIASNLYGKYTVEGGKDNKGIFCQRFSDVAELVRENIMRKGYRRRGESTSLQN